MIGNRFRMEAKRHSKSIKNEGLGLRLLVYFRGARFLCIQDRQTVVPKCDTFGDLVPRARGTPPGPRPTKVGGMRVRVSLDYIIFPRFVFVLQTCYKALVIAWSARSLKRTMLHTLPREISGCEF